MRRASASARQQVSTQPGTSCASRRSWSRWARCHSRSDPEHQPLPERQLLPGSGWLRSRVQGRQFSGRHEHAIVGTRIGLIAIQIRVVRIVVQLRIERLVVQRYEGKVTAGREQERLEHAIALRLPQRGPEMLADAVVGRVRAAAARRELMGLRGQLNCVSRRSLDACDQHERIRA